MRLYQLLEDVENTTSVADCEITGVVCDSRLVEPGSIFICIKGLNHDGHDHAASALENGAAVVVAQKDVGLERQVIVGDTRVAYAKLCANFHGNPSRRLKLIGVTGTNGKSTITTIIKQILESAGHKTGLIGTIQNEIDDMVLPAKFTTPDPAVLQALFARMLQAGCEYAVMEVSSHALDQQRLEGCRFVTGIFTNLTQDHLDYHGTMENYYLAKRKLFDMCDNAVINIDDEYGRRIVSEISCPVKTFSVQDDGAEYTAHNIELTPSLSSFAFVGTGVIARVKFAMPGLFSVSNALAVIAGLLAQGIDLPTIVDGLGGCEGVRGRCEVLKTNTPYTVIIDYAHSPDSLEKLLTTMRGFVKKRILLVFGCGGNRDRTKRPKMGSIAAKYSDYIVLTADSPRDEDPVDISEDIAAGFAGYNVEYVVIPGRYDAIKHALLEAKDGDVVLLAGKGHEDFQVFGFGTIYFDEREVVREILENL